MKPNTFKNTQETVHASSGGNGPDNSESGPEQTVQALPPEHEAIIARIMDLYADLFLHDGFGSIRIEMRFLKKGQKEIIISSGKDFRFVVDWPGPGHRPARGK